MNHIYKNVVFDLSRRNSLADEESIRPAVCVFWKSKKLTGVAFCIANCSREKGGVPRVAMLTSKGDNIGVKYH